MKNIFPFLLFAAIVVGACEEKPIPIPEPATPKRRVLVEELTGVTCTKCPDGARTLTSLQNTFGEGNLIVVSNHSAGNFSNPYPDSKFNFNIPKGQAIADYLGQPLGYPSAAFDRFLKTGSQTAFVPPSQWSAVLNSEFAKDFGLGLFVQNEYNPSTREVKIEVTIDPTQTLSGENRLSVFITQDSIMDPQLDNGVKKKDYIHRHVLRAVVTAATGDILSEPLTAGILRKRSFTFTLPDDTWVAKHCSVVAFVHHGGEPDNEVLQAVERHVVE